MTYRRVLHAALVALFLFLLAPAPSAAAQDVGAVPRVADAELIFQQGLDAFEEGDYGMAYRRFRLVYSDYPLNRKSTAAALMAAKALYRQGEYERAGELLTDLVETFPESSYVDEAERLRGFVQMQQEGGGAAAAPMTLGIALPLRDQDAPLSQAFFNGLRLAVEEHNAEGSRPVRMVFRDTRNDPDTARAAVQTLAGSAGADVVVGPLYSAEALAAGAEAEAAGVVLMAPLATDENVSEGRRYVFQANPTITMRGRLMARFAMRNLRLGAFGIIGQYGNSISERMAEGFEEEALVEGAEVAFYELLENERRWADLPEAVGADTLARAETLYLPVSGRAAPRIIRGALESLTRAPVGLRILGNAEWHDRAIEQQASSFLTTYSNDFYVDEADTDVQAFIRRYREAYGQTPDQLDFTGERLAYTGYDVGRYLIEQQLAHPEQPLPEVLRSAPLYQGLGIRLDFEGGNVNEAMFYHRYRAGRVELLR